MRRTRALATLLAGTVLACGGEDSAGPATGSEPPVVHQVDGAPDALDPVDAVHVESSMAPALVSVVSGVVAVGTADGLWVGSTIEPDTLAALPVVPDDGGPDSTGAVHQIARRSGEGILLAAEQGLFHDATGMLLRSPLTDSVAGEQILTLDAFGEAAAEEIWFVTATGVLHVGGGKIEAIAVAGASGAADAAVAVAPHVALVTVSGTAYLVHLDELDASPIATGLGAVHGFDRSDDGTVHLATDAGLLSRAKDGALTLRTFAASGAPAQPVVSVTAAFGSTLAVTGGALVQIDAEGAHAIAELASALPHGITVDANGDAWGIDGESLYRYRTGRPVSFETDVRPFFAEHCTQCHAEGKEGAPKFDLESYDVAASKSALIVKRLRGVDIAPMPPITVEILTAADFAVVTRWVGGGLKP